MFVCAPATLARVLLWTNCVLSTIVLRVFLNLSASSFGLAFGLLVDFLISVAHPKLGLLFTLATSRPTVSALNRIIATITENFLLLEGSVPNQ